jgi:hypothetical protein
MDIFGTITQALGSMPSATAIGQNLLLGAGTTVVMAGLKSQDGQNSIDPLHLFFHAPVQAAVPATATTPAVPAVPQNVSTISMANFQALPAATQAALIAAGYHII